MILETGLDARIPRRRSLPLGLAALLVLGAAGCGSSSSGRGSASTTTAATTSNTAPVSSSATGSTSSLVAQGSLDLLTYNVAGLPQGLSSSNPVANTPQISPKLNAYAVVLAQEDFTYHTQLMSQALHPYQSSPQPVSSILRPMNDGLNRFSQPPFSGHQRVTWAVSYGVFKMNIDTDTQFAFSAPVGAFVEENDRAFKYQIDPDSGTPYKKFYDPRKWLRAAEVGMAARLDEACADLGSAGKTVAG